MRKFPLFKASSVCHDFSFLILVRLYFENNKNYLQPTNTL